MHIGLLKNLESWKKMEFDDISKKSLEFETFEKKYGILNKNPEILNKNLKKS